MLKRARIVVSGLVQGVGFRPFCYRLAKRLGLVGFVRNTADSGVEIVLEGPPARVREFTEGLKREAPPLARIEALVVEESEPTGEFRDFAVFPSEQRGVGALPVIPADIATCSECLSEILNPSDRRYRYPFTTCVNCGPRFTLIESLPYDRERTSMRAFPLCPACAREYTDPLDRRYRAEPTCCPECGPRFELLDNRGSPISTTDPIAEAGQLLDEGAVLAVKGIGGMHLACDATNDEPIRRLRTAFHRPQQPFALMSLDLERVREFAEVDPAEAELLESPARPIVLLRKRSSTRLSELVAPGLHTVGVMLPYSGIHHLLLRHVRAPALVMTSANAPGLPMITDNGAALRELRGKVDCFLLHDREIVNRCDDSVVRLTAGRTAFLRRSRGYAPMPYGFRVESERCVLALGAELCATATFALRGRFYSTQHIGDTGRHETLEFLKQAVRRLARLLGAERVDAVVCDLHPQYASAVEAERIASEFSACVLRVQHHRAHLRGLMAEHGVEELVGIAADGAGYGEDGRVWGGEVFALTPSGDRRVGGLAYRPMPGGDAAAIHPARMVAGILWGVLEKGELERVLKKHCLAGFPRGEQEIGFVLGQLERGVNTPLTSSTGRVLDAAACLLGVCRERTYEGEAAMKLEAAAARGDPDAVRLPVEIERENGRQVLDTSALLLGALDALERRAPRRHIAAAVQRALAEGLAELAVRASERTGIKTVGVSGGVFYNDAITRAVEREVRRHGLRFLAHREVPPGDGGLSVGQAALALTFPELRA
jgi:hydrogenase maturation protein HypF